MHFYLIKRRYWLKIVSDSFLWIFMTIPAFWLRLESEMFQYWPMILGIIVATAPLKLLCIYIFGHHRRSWQYSSVQDLQDLVISISSFTIVYMIATLVLRQQIFLPLSIPVIEGILTFLALGFSRLVVRLYLKEQYYKNDKKPNKRVIIAGAGDAGVMIAREMQRHPEAGFLPVAFVDDAPHKWNQKVMGITVGGRISQLKKVAEHYNASEVVIALPSAGGDVVRKVVEAARQCGMNSRIIPGINDLITGKVEISQLRKVDLEDLLRREPVKLNTDQIQAYIHNKRILVTGAGGSIGSEIVRQVSGFKPESIILLGRGENSIYHIAREMKADFSHIPIHIKIADVRDVNTMEKIFEDLQPEVVFHAAAHKHVPLMEDNPSQAIFNNIGGTRNLVNLALDYDVKYFVNISTDKAVNPTSIMGASKRIAEYLVQRAADKAQKDQIFVSVRFGNVLGSRGSVIPVFKEQISKGGPITVTHPQMIRYFMTIPEASQLVLQAGALNQNGSVFVLDMGEPVNISDMARELVRLSGLDPDKDIKIEYTGMRPGEKLYEELMTAEEGTDVTTFEKILVAKNNTVPKDFDHALDLLFDSAQKANNDSIRKNISTLVPSFQGYNNKTSSSVIEQKNGLAK